MECSTVRSWACLLIPGRVAGHYMRGGCKYIIIVHEVCLSKVDHLHFRKWTVPPVYELVHVP